MMSYLCEHIPHSTKIDISHNLFLSGCNELIVYKLDKFLSSLYDEAVF